MTRAERKIQTYENILAVSAKLFLEKGYEKTRMQDITKASGLAKGTIFYHFKSKEAILHAVLLRQGDASEQIFRDWIKELEGLKAREKIMVILERNFEDSRLRCFDHVIATQMQNPHFIVANMQEAVNRNAPILAQLFREGLKDRSIKTEFPDECAEVLLLLMNTWCDPVLFECNSARLNRRLEFIQVFAKQFGAGIVNDKFIISYKKYIKKIYVRIK